jgi:hypothetical protein
MPGVSSLKLAPAASVAGDLSDQRVVLFFLVSLSNQDTGNNNKTIEHNPPD